VVQVPLEFCPLILMITWSTFTWQNELMLIVY